MAAPPSRTTTSRRSSSPPRHPTGAWRRRSLLRADGTVDATTSVTWVQGPTLYVDLRQPAAGSCVAQEGFAGRLAQAGDAVVWHRLVDLRPAAGMDAGRLVWTGDDTLVEHGRDDAYVEQWERRADGSGPAAAVHLRGADGRHAVLVRCGAWAGWASGRTCEGSIPHERDTEIAIAVRDADGRWRPRRSSRPGAPDVGVVLEAGGRARTPEAAWEVLALEGRASDLPAWDGAGLAGTGR